MKKIQLHVTCLYVNDYRAGKRFVQSRGSRKEDGGTLVRMLKHHSTQTVPLSVMYPLKKHHQLYLENLQ